MMIKVAHLITDLSTGGSEMMLYKLLSRIDRSQFQSLVISMTDHGDLGSRIETIAVPVFTLGMRRGWPNPLALLRLIHILRSERPDILQTWLYHADLMGLLAGKLAGIRSILWNVRCAYMDLSHYPVLTRLVLRVSAQLSKFPSAVLTNSQAGRLFHESLGFSPRQWKIISNGFDLEEFGPYAGTRDALRKQLGLPADTILIGLVARYDPMKDHDNFLQACRLLLRRHDDVHFVLAGSGISLLNEQLKRQIEALAIEKHLHLLGERNDMPRLMAALDIVCSSSYGEGFPNVIGEAMACGVPCVVTDVGDSAWIVGDTGRMVPPKNTEALALALEDLVSLGMEERLRLGAAARQRIAQYFSLPVVVRQYEELYTELVAT
jgi:glycosyltransferase involved in cell wall biosynthesis